MPIQNTLVLLKPDAVMRQVAGELISRFERCGLKIIGANLIRPDEKTLKEHYADIAERRGEAVLEKLLAFMSQAPVFALCLRGNEAVAVVRKIVGDTEPFKALSGTIRADYSTESFENADSKEVAVANLIHASSSTMSLS